MFLWTGVMEIENLLLQRDKLAVVSSNLTGNIWNGQVTLGNYTNGAFTPTNAMYFNSGLKHGLWHAGKLYLGSDEGHLYIYSQELQLLYSTSTHHDSLTAIAKKGKSLITADQYE